MSTDIVQFEQSQGRITPEALLRRIQECNLDSIADACVARIRRHGMDATPLFWRGVAQGARDNPKLQVKFRDLSGMARNMPCLDAIAQIVLD